MTDKPNAWCPERYPRIKHRVLVHYDGYFDTEESMLVLTNARAEFIDFVVKNMKPEQQVALVERFDRCISRNVIKKIRLLVDSDKDTGESVKAGVQFVFSTNQSFFDMRQVAEVLLLGM